MYSYKNPNKVSLRDAMYGLGVSVGFAGLSFAGGAALNELIVMPHSEEKVEACAGNLPEDPIIVDETEFEIPDTCETGKFEVLKSTARSEVVKTELSIPSAEEYAVNNKPNSFNSLFAMSALVALGILAVAPTVRRS